MSTTRLTFRNNASGRITFLLTTLLSTLLLLSPPAHGYHETLSIPSEYRDNFEEKAVTMVHSPTDMEFTPDGKYLFVTSKHGTIWRVAVEDMDDPDKEADEAVPEEVFTIPHRMCLNGARGLGGIAIHPEYPSKPYLYVYHNYDKYKDCASSSNLDEGPVNRMSRWTLNSDLKSVDPESELVMFDTRRLNTQTHNSGYIAFGKDGYLYVTVGEAGTKKAKNSEGTPYPMAFDVMLGVVVRMTDDGGIPPSNPFSPENNPKAVRCNKDGQSGDAEKPCQEVFATGLRNPFRFAMDPNAEGTRFFINDVGDAAWERVLEGGDGHSGAQYGYPAKEGPCDKTTGKDYQCKPEDWFDYPVHWYKHNSEDGGAITGGAFVPKDAGWPSSFDDAYIYGEYAWGGIRVMHPNKNAGCPYDQCKEPISDWDVEVFSEEKKVIGMTFGPHKNGKSLYFLQHLPGARGSTGKAREGIFRIAYTGSANRDPKARIEVDRSVGFAPFSVQFDSSESYDPDDEDNAFLTYEWDFDGDGIVDSTEPNPKFTYSNPGTFEAVLQIFDSRGGKSDKTFVRIDVDNSPPVPKILSPTEGTTFAVGDKIVLVGEAYDKEDGKLDDVQLTWEVRQHHNNHYHPWLDPTPGNNIPIDDAPPPEDFFYITTTTSYLAIHLTATDSSGLSSTAILDVRPRLVNLVFDSVPSGIPILINQDPYVTPTRLIAWENDNFELEVPTEFNPEDSSDEWTFSSWSDGENDNIRKYSVPAETDPDPIVVTFEKVGVQPATSTPALRPTNEPATPALRPTKAPTKQVDVESKPTRAPTEKTEVFTEIPNLPGPSEATEGDSDDGGSSADAPKVNKDGKFVVDLLDMTASVRFGSDEAWSNKARRRLNSDTLDVVSQLERDFKETVSDAVSESLVDAIDLSGFYGLRFARKGERATIDEKGLLYTTTFGGVAIFDDEGTDGQAPNKMMVQKAQIVATEEVKTELLSEMREFVSEAGNVMGFSRVAGVSAELIDKPDIPVDMTYAAETQSEGSEENDSSMRIGLIVIGVALCVALVATGAVFVYLRRKRRSLKKEIAQNKQELNMTDDSNAKNPYDSDFNEGFDVVCDHGGKKNTPYESSGSDTEEETPANSPMKQGTRVDPYGPHSGDVGDYDYPNNDDLSVAGSVANSVASSVQQVASDLMTKLSSAVGGNKDESSGEDSEIPGPPPAEEDAVDDNEKVANEVGKDRGFILAE